MAVDMKQIIAQSAKDLLMDKSVKKLTVKDIVDKCHITRQSFYYHFEDIPALFRWMLEQQPMASPSSLYFSGNCWALYSMT